MSAVFTRQRAYVNHLVGNGDYVLVVLHHQDGVAPVPEVPQQFGHAENISGMHAGAGFIKDVSHPGEGTAHIAHQLQPLGLAAGEGGGLPVHGEIGQTDVDHPGQRRHQSGHDGLRPGVVDGFQNADQLGKLHFAHLVDAVSRHLARQGGGVQPLALADGAGPLLHQIHQPLHRGFLQVGRVPVDEHPVEVVGDSVHLFVEPGTVRGVRAVEQAVSFRLGEILPLLIQGENARLGVLFPVPVSHMESGQIRHPLVPGLFGINAALNVDGHYLANTGALRAHAVGVIEGEVGGGAHIGRSNAGIEQPQGGVQVADGANRGPGVASQAALVHDDRGGQVVDALHPRLFVLGQPPPHEGGVGLVHLPLALGGDGVEYDAGFA